MEQETENVTSADMTGEKESELAVPTEAEASSQTPLTSVLSPAAVQQSERENRHFAAARRKAEQEENLRRMTAQANAAAQSKVTEALRASGILPSDADATDPFEALRAYVKRQTAPSETEEEGMKAETGAGTESAKTETQTPPAPMPAEAPGEAARARIAGEMEEIRRLDPTVKQISDLQKTEAYPKIYALCKKGYSLSDAYKLANLDAIRAQTAAAVRQSVINAAAGKEHMVRTESRGAGQRNVPREIREGYLALNPAATDSEISAHYSKYLKD